MNTAVNKKPTFDEDDYFNPSKILSYNKLFNFVNSNRGGGKTFAAKRLVINDFLKTGGQFVYLRRYNNENDDIKTFWSDISNYYPDHSFGVHNRRLWIDNKVAGYYLALNTSGSKKSVSYSEVNTIIFDEYIIEQSARGYLKNEVQLFLGLYETIARTRDVRVLFLSNSVSQVNPYFIYWNIHLVQGQKFWNNNPQIVVQRYSNKAFIAKKKQTKFGQIINNTKYGDYLLEDSWLDDSDTFIERMSGDCRPICELAYMGRKYFVWCRNEDSIIFVTDKSKTPDGTVKLSLTTDDHNIDYKFVKSVSSSNFLETLYDAYTSGLVRFNNLVSKQAFLEIIQLV